MVDILLSNTTSICPTCKKEVSADVIERNGSIFMRKCCGEHGSFEIKIAKHAWYYKGITGFYNSLLPQGALQCRNSPLYVFLVTSKCNLNCPICFTDANATRSIQEVSLTMIEKYLNAIRNQKKIIRLSGGEPTIREDLPEIIRLIKESGNFPYIFTNGIKLKNYSYLKLLKESGLNGILLWLDSMHNDNVHKQIRGENVLKNKMQAIDNIKKLNMPFCFYHVKVRGINDADTKDCWEYVQKNGFIKSLWIKSYVHLGRKGFSRENEFIMDELIEEIADMSNGVFSLEDAYYYQKFNCILAALRKIPFCYYVHSMILPRGNSQPIRFIKFAKEIDEFERRWMVSTEDAKRYFLMTVLKKIVCSFPVMGYLILRYAINRQPMYKVIHDCLPAGHFLLLITTFYNSYNYDKLQAYNGCTNSVFNYNPINNIPLCDMNMRHFG